MDKEKRIHDLAIAYATLKFSEAEKSPYFKTEQEKIGKDYELDYLYDNYMTALAYYEEDENLFSLDKYFEE